MNRRNAVPRPPLDDALVSVVLPVFNEAEVLPVLRNRIAAEIARLGADCEILFVDDGSTDNSPEVLDHLAADDPRVRVIHLSRNFGHQAAVQAGLARARGDAVVLMDSDMQDAPEAIPRFLEAWQEGHDVVYALRTGRKEGPLKRTLFAAFHRLMASVASVPIPADAGIFGLIDRRVARELAALGETDRYLPGLRSWVGFSQVGIEVERHARYDERPRVSLGGLVRLAKTAMFSFSTFPLALFHVIGVSAAALFMGLSTYALWCKLVAGSAIPGWTSHVLTGSFFGALNALGICILGEYVIRIHDQVRGRPLYLIDRLVNFDRGDDRGESCYEDQSNGRDRHDARQGDAPYVELMREAADLLDAGAVRPKSDGTDYDEDDEPFEPVRFPQTAEEVS